MKKTLEINGVTFELGKPVPEGHWSDRTVYDCYGRPSDAKRAIWEDWASYILDTFRTATFGVASYNGFQFTIDGVVDWEGQQYQLRISKAHNTLCPIITE